jgi:tRNA threonylcarbamoyladenosine biosynthesis protein TsaE
MSMNDEYITNSGEETQELGERFAGRLKMGDFIALYGDLGSGKTTFIQGLARGLGITRRIISPTFIIARHYKINNGSFYHIDLYRTESKHDLLGVGLDQIIEDKNNIVALEWAEKMGELLPKKRIDIRFQYLNGNKRRIFIEKYE